MKKFLRTAMVLAVCEGLILAPAHAGFMDDFYTSAGAAVNATPAQVRQTGSGSFITGGSVVWRVPNRTFTPFLWQAPHIKAGCGGIDMYLGSFGFANTSQFVNYLRNVGQNALGLFFKMALKAMSPELDGAITELTSEMNKLNQNLGNSCETAGKLLSGMGITQESMDRAVESAKRFAIGDGSSSDAAAAKQTYGGDLAASKAKADANGLNSGGKAQAKAARNVVWSAMNSGDLSDFPNSLKETAQSLIGVRGTKPNATDPTKFDPVIFPETIHMGDLVGTWNQVTAPIRVLVCDEYDECLNPAPSPQAQKPFARIAYENLVRLRDKIANRTALDATDNDAIKMLAMTTIPVWKILELTSSPGRLWLSDMYIQKYSNVIGYELAIGFINTFSSDLEKSLGKTKADETSAEVKSEYEQIRLRLARLRDEAEDVKKRIDASSGGQAGLLAELQHLERTLYSNMSSRVLDNLKYASR